MKTDISVLLKKLDNCITLLRSFPPEKSVLQNVTIVHREITLEVDLLFELSKRKRPKTHLNF
jgi:hypothetical protein